MRCLWSPGPEENAESGTWAPWEVPAPWTWKYNAGGFVPHLHIRDTSSARLKRQSHLWRGSV